MKCKQTPIWLILISGCLLFVFSARAQGTKEQLEAQLAAAGQKAMAQGDFATAQVNLEQLEKLAPEVAEVHAMLAVIDFKQREYTKTIDEVRSAQRLKPGLPNLGSLLGAALSEQGHYKEAIPYLEKGLQSGRDPAVKRICGLELMRDYSNLNRDADAVRVAVTMNQMFPNDPEVLYHTGRIYGNRAYEVMEKLRNIAPNSVWMLQAQGEANESRHDWPAAIVAYQHVLVLDPGRPGIHYQLGKIYLDQYRASQSEKDKQAAIQQFQDELKVDPSNADAVYELANIQEESGNLSAAGEQFAVLLKQVPDFEQALVGLGGIDLATKQAAKAVPLLERATRIRPDDVVAWWRLSQAYRAVGNHAGQMRALAIFEKLHNGADSKLLDPPSMDAVTQQNLSGPGGQ
ncbi:MAG: tetratricopeptide repeat protein [Acidobacteriaceae bacterium]